METNTVVQKVKKDKGMKRYKKKPDKKETSVPFCAEIAQKETDVFS